MALACATALNFFTMNWFARPFQYALAAFVLASPYLVLFCAQLRFGMRPKRSAFLTVGLLLLLPVWLIVSFFARWMHADWVMLSALGVLMAAVAIAYTGLSLFFRDR